MKRLGIVLLLCALTACQDEAEEQDGTLFELQGFDPSGGADLKAACEERGGTWGTGGASGAFLCFEETRDAGKSCSRGSDCEGLCLARSRTCAPIKPLFGCNEVLTDSGVQATLCID